MDSEAYYTASVRSASSSTRTVRPLPQPPPHVHDTTQTPAMNFTNYATTHSHHYHAQHPNSNNHRQAPIPPARSSSLLVPASPHYGVSHVPSVQVIQPTPTKTRKYRRRSTGQHSVSSTEISASGSPQARTRPAAGVRTALVENRTRKADEDDEEDDEEDSENERTNAALAARKARAREKGRDRQRRKRERDRIAREAAQAAGVPTGPSTSLTTSSHLPIPSRTLSVPNLMALALPSSSSSSCSPLPVTASYLSLSPGQNYNLSTASTSVSGQSSPSALFSPASSTPGTAYGEVTGIWSMAEGASSMSVLDARGKVRGGKGKARASSTSQATASTISAASSRRTGPSPAKRRKSVPEPEYGQVLSAETQQVGLGVSFDGNGPMARPISRRMTSDTSAQPSTRAVSPTRSPTPPPVPTLPAQYRHASQPSPQAEYFADLVVGTLKANKSLHGMLRKLDLSGDDLDEIRGELGGVYDRWRVTKGLDAVHINQPPSDIDMSTSQSMAPPHHSSATVDPSSTPISPKRTLSQADQSFFTPASHRPPSRRDLRGAATAMPLVYESAAAENQGAQLMASMQQDSPLAVHAASQHSRTRSLSSASMLARGLVLNPMLAVQPQIQSQGRWESEDETTSPGNSLLQTPSTAQGGFPTAEAMAGYAQSFGMAQMNPMGGHWRSATDPTHGRAYVMHGQGQGALPQPVWHPMPPLDANGNSSPPSTMHSARSTNATVDSPKNMPLQQYTPFTPQHSKPGQVQVGHVPFTPPTPIQSRVANYGMSMGGMMSGAYGEQSMPMYYTTSMMSGSVNGGISSGTGEETEVYRPSGDGVNRSG